MSEEEIAARISNLEEAVKSLQDSQSNIESRFSQFEEESDRIKKELSQLRDSIEQHRDQISELMETSDSVEEDLMVVEERLDAIVSRIEESEKNIKENRRDAEEQRAGLARRVTEIENLLDIEGGDREMENIIASDIPVLERFKKLPENIRDNNPSMDRAATIWENFDRFSEYTPKGWVITSKDVKKLLTTVEEENFEWVIVYRAMEAFDKYSPPEFDYIETDSWGKALIRYRDTAQERAESMQNSGEK